VIEWVNEFPVCVPQYVPADRSGVGRSFTFPVFDPADPDRASKPEAFGLFDPAVTLQPFSCGLDAV
jgi:hypothetical protein